METPEHIKKALDEIDRNGIPAKWKSDKYDLEYDDRFYHVITGTSVMSGGRIIGINLESFII